MKNNEELQKDVQNAIKWEPLLHAAEIGVTAKDGVVSLTGEVDSYIKKLEAESAAKKVIGVKALIEKIEVRIPNKWSKTDSEVVEKVLKAIKKTWFSTKGKVTVKVEDGWVTLEGELPWNYQRDEIKHAINYLPGVKGVTNSIKIKSESNDALEKSEIEEAIARNWSITDNDIHVKVSGTTVTLSGTVTSWYQKEEAERIAWKTLGIWHVNNELKVDYYYKLVS